jgi:nucleotide-binding universal stress UspA family protein
MYRNLLVPIDGNELADKAIKGSIELAKQLGAEITAFIAEPDPPLPTEGQSVAVIMAERDDHAARTTQHAKDVLAQFEARARDAGVGFSGHHIHSAGIARAISRAAEEHGCDMIVMATHGRGALGELVFGSHTKDVMARSKLPLLVLQ